MTFYAVAYFGSDENALSIQPARLFPTRRLAEMAAELEAFGVAHLTHTVVEITTTGLRFEGMKGKPVSVVAA